MADGPALLSFDDFVGGPPKAAETASGTMSFDDFSGDAGGGGVIDQFSKGLKGSIIGQNIKLAGSALEGVGDIVDSPTIQAAGKATKDYGSQKMEGFDARVPSIANIRTDSPSNIWKDTTDYLSYQLGSGLGSMAPTVAAGGAVAAVTANPIAGLVAGAALPSLAQNFGDMRESALDDDAIKARIDKGDLTMKQVSTISALASVPMAALDLVGLETVLGAGAAKPAKDALKGELAKWMVKQTAEGAASEGGTEGLQQVIEEWGDKYLGSNKTFKDQVISVVDNAIGGALPGGVISGGRAAIQPRAAAIPTTPPPGGPQTPPPSSLPGASSAGGDDGGPGPSPVLPPSPSAVPEAASPVEQPTAPIPPMGVARPGPIASDTAVAPQNLAGNREEIPRNSPQIPPDGGQVAVPEVPASTSETPPAEPTQAQKEAGNYKKGHVSWNGLNISIETPTGATRSGTDPDGNPWSVTMPADYGYIRRTEGQDGEQMDVLMGPNHKSPHVYVVDTVDPATKAADEHKVLLGFNTPAHARATFEKAYPGTALQRVGGLKLMNVDEFKAWLKNGDQTAPVAAQETPRRLPAGTQVQVHLADGTVAGNAVIDGYTEGARPRVKFKDPVMGMKAPFMDLVKLVPSEVAPAAEETRSTASPSKDATNPVAKNNTPETGAQPTEAAQPVPTADEHPGLTVKSLETGKKTTVQPQGTIPPRKQIGTNADGNPVFEDFRGVRSYVQDGVRVTEPVGIVPTREGVAVSAKTKHDREFEPVEQKTVESEQKTATPTAMKPEGERVQPDLLGGPEVTEQTMADKEAAQAEIYRQRADGLDDHDIGDQAHEDIDRHNEDVASGIATKSGERRQRIARALLSQLGEPTQSPTEQDDAQEAKANASNPAPAAAARDDKAGDEGQGAANVPAAPAERPTRGGDQRPDGEPAGSPRAGEREGNDAAAAEPAPRPAETGGEDQGRGRDKLEGGARNSDGLPERGRDRKRDTGGAADFRAEPGGLKREGSWKQAAERNLDAIDLVHQLETDKRQATPAEQKVLAKYVGWGASELANNVFRNAARDPQTGEINLRPAWATPEWRPIVERAAKSMTNEELQTALRTTQYAHYTSEAVIRSIWKGLDRIGFKGGKILEPGMGTGLFPIAAPKDVMDASRYTGIEFDRLTAAIAKQLLPEQTVLQADFVTQKLPNGFYDLAVGNPPFANTVITDDPAYRKYRFSLHDFFFAKAIDKVRPGGLLTFVTSRYTMDKLNDKARAYMADRADLLGAIRLPQTAFKQNAGTEVVTDVLFLRKRGPDDAVGGEAWKGTKEIDVAGEKVAVNEYFAAHPEMVLGTHITERGMHHANEYSVAPLEGDIEKHFAAAVEKLPEGAYAEPTGPAAVHVATMERDFNPTIKKEGALYVKDGNVLVVQDGSGVDVRQGNSLKPAEVAWLKDYVPLRDAIKQAQYDQLKDGDWEKSLAELNKVYDAFVKKNGPVNEFSSTERTTTDEDGNEQVTTYRRYKNRKLWELDVEGQLVPSLERITEDGKIVKGSFFTGRTLQRPMQREIVTTQDALMVSLDQRGRLDLPHIAELLKKPQAEIIKDLGDTIYQAPSGDWQTSDEYLSGDVVSKLEEAKAAAAADGRYDRNVQALIKVQPKPLSTGDISVSLGAGWVAANHIDDFASDVLDIDIRSVYEPSVGKWHFGDLAKAPRGRSARRAGRGVGSEWGTPSRSPSEILDAVLNNREIKVTYTDQDKKTHVDTTATAAANEKATKMREAFKSWVWTKAERSKELSDLYNRKFNNIAPRTFDGSHLTLPGLSLKYDLYDHQKRAIWRIIQTGNTYLAHAVGAGKTLEMIVSGMEQRRLGLIRRPAYVVPNHMLQQFASEFLDAYPTANIMVASDHNFHTTRRARFVAQAALNDPDAIVMTHSSFSLLGTRPETSAPIVNEIIANIEAVAESMGNSNETRITRKKLEKQIERIQRKFETKEGAEAKDQGVMFEDMGVDFLHVDEMHEFRKLDFVTDQGNIKGIDPLGSQKALDLYIKTRYLDDQNPGRSLVGASGTPVTNTMAELYTVMRYFDNEGLKRDGIGAFDAWAQMFGEVVPNFEMNAAGKYEVVRRFSKFVNVPEMMKRVRNFMDVLTNSQLGGLVPRPTINGGRPASIVTPTSAAQKRYMEKELLRRIKISREWKPSPQQPGNPDPLINIITDGRLSAIDMRFVRPGSENDPNSKLNKMIDEIIATHQATSDAVYRDPISGTPDKIPGAAQIVFSSVGFGDQVAASRGFDVRGWMTQRFREAGIKPTEVAWMSDYKTDAKKQAMFKEMRNGQKRILIGSPKNMGTGLNVQKRLKALHYLSPPWYPSDVEQPHGRIERQGNLNDTIDLKWYATKGTYDSTGWNMVARKARFIEQAFTGDDSVRKIDDVTEASQYEMASALAAGDERAIQMVGLQADIERMERLRYAHIDEQRRLQSNLEYMMAGTRDNRQRIAMDEAALKNHVRIDKPAAVVDGHDVEGHKDVGTALMQKAIRETKKWRPAHDDDTATIDLGKLNDHYPVTLELKMITVRDEDAEGKVTKSLQKGGKIVVHAEPLEFGGTDRQSVDEMEGTNPQTVAQRMVNAVNGIPRDLEETKAKLAETQKKIKDTQARIGVPFEHEGDLNDKVAEVARIKAELAAEGSAIAGVDTGVPSRDEIERFDNEGGGRPYTPPPSRIGGSDGGGESYSVTPRTSGAVDENRDALAADVSRIVHEITGGAADVEVHDVLYGAGPGLVRSGAESEAPQEVAGSQLGNLIRVSLSDKYDPTDTALHEAWHWLRANRVFAPDEEAALERGRPRLEQLVKDAGLSPEKMAAEEVEAVAFARWSALRDAEKPVPGLLPGIIRAFRKAARFFQALAKAARGRGVTSADEVFQSARDGEIASREAKNGPVDTQENYAIFGDKKQIPGTATQEAAIRRNMGSDERPLGRRIADFVNKSFARRALYWRQGFIDQQAPLEALERQNNGGKLEDAATSAFKAIKMAKNGKAVMHVLLKHGMIKLNTNAAGELEWFSMDDSWKHGGLEKVFEPIAEKGLLHLWQGWAMANREKRLITEGRNSMTQAEIDDLLALEKDHPEFRKVLDDWTRFNKRILDMAEAAGVINAEQRAIWEKDDYVPFYRITDEDLVEGPGTGSDGRKIGSGISTLTGKSGLKSNEIIENMVLNVSSLVNRSFKNVARRKAWSLMMDAGVLSGAPVGWSKVRLDPDKMADVLQDLGVQVRGLTDAQKAAVAEMWTMQDPPDPRAASVRIDGKAVWGIIEDPLLFNAIVSLGAPHQLGAIMKMFHLSKEFLTEGVTMDPGFMVANGVRDSLTAWIFGAVKIPFTSTLRGATKAWREDPELLKIMAAGAYTGGFYRTGPKDVGAKLKARLKGSRETVIDAPRKMWEFWHRIGAASEAGSRIGIFEHEKAKGASDAEAAYQALDLLNFGTHGSFNAMRTLLEMVPFLNARLQGLDKVYRASVDNPKTVLLRGAIITAASLALLAWNQKQPWYEEMDDWKKDVYYPIRMGGVTYLLPQPFEMGSLFSTIPERLVRLFTGADDIKKTMESLGRMILGTFAMDPTPQLLKPLIEEVANMNFFTNTPIVPAGLDKFLPEAQVTQRTGDFARRFGEATGTSPVRLEHIVRGYLGALGLYMLQAANVVTRAIAPQTAMRPDGTKYEIQQPAGRIDDLPIVHRFANEEPQESTRWLTDYYDTKREVETIYSTIKRYETERRADDAVSLLHSERSKVALYPAVEAVGQALSEFRKAEEQVRLSDKSPAEKRRLLDRIIVDRNALARKLVEAAPATARLVEQASRLKADDQKKLNQ